MHFLRYILNQNRAKEEKKNKTINRYLYPLEKETKNISQSFSFFGQIYIYNQHIWLIDSIFIYLLLYAINQSRKQYSKIKVARTSRAVMAMRRNQCAETNAHRLGRHVSRVIAYLKCESESYADRRPHFSRFLTVNKRISRVNERRECPRMIAGHF